MSDRKMEQAAEDKTWQERPMVIIACQVLQDLLERLLPSDLDGAVIFQDYGLHRIPDRITGELQQRIDAVEEPSVIVLGYGLCGNGVQGVRSGRHTLVIPRTDDCIAILLGSRAAYLREFNAVPGTYYLSRGWLESGSHPLRKYEEYAETYGPEDAEWILDQEYQHYERLALVGHSQVELEACRPTAQQVARFCERWDMRYEEILGSEDYVRRLVEAAILLRHGGWAARDQIGRDFVVVSPGGVVRSDAFVAGISWQR